MSHSHTWLAKSWNWWKYTPLGMNPLISSLMSKYSGSPGVPQSIASSLSGSEKGLFGLFSGAGKYGNFLSDILGNLGNALNQILTGDSLENLIKYWTHSGITNEAKETMDLQLENQQLLNEQEYQRKIDFYEQYESPEARVRQYMEAGLNPMLLAGGGAGVSASGGVGSAGSAGSAGASGGDPVGLITGLASVLYKGKELEIRDYEAQTHRLQATDYADYLRAMASQTRQRTTLEAQRFPLEMSSLEQQIGLLKSQINRTDIQALLDKAGIKKTEQESAVLAYEATIKYAQSQYANEYYRLANEYQSLMNDSLTLNNEFSRKTLDNRVKAVEYQMYNLLYEAALKSKAFENFDQANIRAWIEAISKGVSSVGSLGSLFTGGFSGAGSIIPWTSPTSTIGG